VHCLTTSLAYINFSQVVILLLILKASVTGGIIVRKTVAVGKNLNGVLPSALAIGVGLIY
jgi:hypothetical protein